MKEYSSGCASPAASETTTSSCSGASSSPVSYVGGDGAAAMWDGEGVEDWVYGYVLADDRKRRLESKKAEAKTKLAVFYPRCTVQQELERLRQVREESPAYATQIIAQASNMIEMAEKGYLQGIIQVVLAAREGEILLWGITNMFRKACVYGHVTVVVYMLENGVSADSPGLQNLLHDILEMCPAQSEARLIKVFELLLNKGGYDVNCIRQSDSQTPLHVACRLGFATIFKVLVISGADIHAIDENDCMPLTYAQSLEDQTVANMLRKMGAKACLAKAS